ncbi:MAG: hypothetical protein KC731_28410 [Myxococcales bacterium]|nr:hypothetical protein [Myxococcales bacterium]
MVRTTLTSLGIVLALASVAIGCGNEPPPKNPDSWLDSLEQKDPGKKPNLDVVGDDDDDDDDAAPKKPAEPAPPAVTAKPSSGRPLIQKGPTTSIAETFGTTPGAVLKLSAEGGEIVLKIPEFALDTG